MPECVPERLPRVDIAYLPNEVKAAVRLLQEHPAKWLPIIARDRCTGCGLCLDCCGPNCLANVAGIAVLARPEMCGGAGDCMAVCATEAIEMAWVISAGERLVGPLAHASRDRRPSASMPPLRPSSLDLSPPAARDS